MTNLSPFLIELWRLIVAVGKPQHMGEYRCLQPIRALCREHHTHLRTGLDRLAEDGYLRRAVEGQQIQSRYWWTIDCRIPLGCDAPGSHAPVGVGFATARQHVNAVMPADPTPLHRPIAGPAFDYAQHPSRRGDRLHYRDGRVTDLDGRPIP